MNPGFKTWSIALPLSVMVHFVLVVGLKPPTEGFQEPPAGASVSVEASLAGIMGQMAPNAEEVTSNDTTTVEPTQQARPIAPRETTSVQVAKLQKTPARENTPAVDPSDLTSVTQELKPVPEATPKNVDAKPASEAEPVNVRRQELDAQEITREMSTVDASTAEAQSVTELSVAAVRSEDAAPIEELDATQNDDVAPTPEPAASPDESVTPVEEVDTARSDDATPAVETDATPNEDAIAPQEVEAAENVETAAVTTDVVAEPTTPDVQPVEVKPTSTEAVTTEPPKKKKSKKRAARTPPGNNQKGSAGKRQGSKKGKARASSGAILSYASRVRARIAGNRPRSVGRGRVVVSFGLTASGGLRYARIGRSSGNAGVDRAALSAVRRSSPFPRPPKGASSGQLRFSIPFSFR